MKKLLFLYTELADYFVNCLNLLAQDPELEIHLVFWPVKSEAPFQFSFNDKIQLYQRADYNKQTLHALSQEIAPQLLFCSGWRDKAYLSIAKHYRSSIPSISAMDNHWKGSLRQQIARVISPLTLKRYFSHIWIPGQAQKEYALKLGFKKEQILSGFYVANQQRFEALFRQREDYPKNFIFVGRYIPHKGIYDLWQAFIELKEEYPNDWTLTCLGTGSDWDQRIQHPDIKHLGFIQPQDMSKHILNASVFILPSHFEPWGVVVHEMAYAGLAMICSSEIGASRQFLKEGENGFSFAAHSLDELKNAMRKFIQMEEAQILKMGDASHDIAQSLTPQTWVNTLKDLI
ncbi:glycosyltransferase [Lentisphaera profundi]|uniref:Glycosyltransferase n=1 Tax=Lentisphaera profundi TaxID=1658616 RepID=A0ABY7VY56_9BACT|nr:glycosyltransferase [Lentisphaera profundi]WDE98204.1 glycosyltransferase [Lentisphaera profundi]